MESLLSALSPTVWIIIAAVALVVIIVICFAVYIGLKNKLIRIVNSTEESWSTIDVYLKKRFDLIPNLVATVKGYAKHEEETFVKVTSLRSKVSEAATPEQRIEAEKQLTSALTTLMNVTVERYPDLKANQNFLDLSAQLKSIETDLVQARKYYNGNVRRYNDAIALFPTSIVARKMRLDKKPYFELDSAEERKAPTVEF